MKHTRMERHEEKIRAVVKRNKRIITFTTLVGLVCPATLGTIQALADETAPTTLEQPAELAVQPTAEPVAEAQPTVTPTPELVTPSQPVVETPTQEPVTPETKPVIPDQPVITNEVVEAPTPATEQASEVTADVNSNDVAPAQEVAPVATEWYDILLQISDDLYGSDLIQRAENAGMKAELDDFIDRYYLVTDPYWLTIGEMQTVYCESTIDTMRALLVELQGLISRVDASQPIETVTYTIKCYYENADTHVQGTTDIVKTAKKGESITEIAPEVEYFFAIGESTQTQTIGDDTVFVFRYRWLMPTGLFYDVVGDTTAKVGETKTYQYNEVRFYNNGSMTETIINIGDTNYPLTSSNPTDVIVGNTITFGSEGTRTLIATENAGAPLEVTVTKDGVTPPTPSETDKSGLEEAIKKGEEAIKDGGWKDDSNLNTAIEDGKAVRDDENATQSQIDEATKNITDAINALEKADNGGNGNNGGNNNGGAGNGNNGNNGGGNTGNGNNGAGNGNSQNDNNGAGNSGNQNGGGTGNNSGAGTGSNSQNGNGNKTGSNANNTSNKVVQTNTNTNNPNSNKDNLPQTGEETTMTTALAGLAMVGLSVVAWIKRRRKV